MQNTLNKSRISHAAWLVNLDEVQSRLTSLKGNSKPSEPEDKRIHIETHRPKRRTLNQSRRTKDRFLRENKLLMYALRQNKNVATPPLENYADNPLATIYLFMNKELTFPFIKGMSAIALSLPIYAKLPWWV